LIFRKRCTEEALLKQGVLLLRQTFPLLSFNKGGQLISGLKSVGGFAEAGVVDIPVKTGI